MIESQSWKNEGPQYLFLDENDRNCNKNKIKILSFYKLGLT